MRYLYKPTPRHRHVSTNLTNVTRRSVRHRQVTVTSPPRHQLDSPICPPLPLVRDVPAGVIEVGETAIVEDYELPFTVDGFLSELNPILGKTPFEAAAAIVEDYELPFTRWMVQHQGSSRFLEAAKRLNDDASTALSLRIHCVTAGKGAGMEVVAVPSLPKQTHIYAAADEVINSLLDLRPEKWGCHPSMILICLQMVILLPFQNTLQECILVGRDYRPGEPWLLHEFDEDFYGEDLRLAIVGYIRPEANFPSLEALIAKIHEDRQIAEKALDLPLYAGYKDSPHLLTSPLQQNDHNLFS
ncbi:hypothetical protein Scep_028541 [Stephania cephalantha]|uniref:riboflavin kinase n=1 Tax=Stephania cephalantha TaxID=152367 RepID=A0AAP0HJP5_9MAGN